MLQDAESRDLHGNAQVVLLAAAALCTPAPGRVPIRPARAAQERLTSREAMAHAYFAPVRQREGAQ